MTEQDELLKKRFAELAAQSHGTNSYTFTGFLGEAESAVYYQMERELAYAGVTVFGGRAEASRNMIRFGSQEEFGYVEEFPIRCICIEPLHQKFADALSHRDFLGAVMNLGIERSEVGDIVVQDKKAYLFASEKMTPYICENLDKVKHTNVRCLVTEELPREAQVHTESMVLQVSSERVDAVASKVFRLSRSEILDYFRTRKVFVNGRLCENNSYYLKEADTVSVRGYGKFRFSGVLSLSRKGKQNVLIEKYV